MMDESDQDKQPEMSEYKGKPIIRIPTDDGSPDATSHWMSFGKNKAKAIVKFFDVIKKFAEE